MSAPTIDFRPHAELRAYARNSRKHSAAQVEQVACSIEEFGFTNPVLVDGDQIVAGHGRVLAAQALASRGKAIRLPNGRELPAGCVPVLDCSGWTEEQRRAYVIADNQLAQTSEWDMDALRGEMAFLSDAGFGLDVIGFADQFQAELLAGRSKDNGRDPDDVPPVGAAPFTMPGDVWNCGPHRVACGDATDVGTWTRLMQGELADAAWCDPPYNVAYSGRAGKIKNDDLAADKFLSLLLGLFGRMADVMRPGAPIYVAHADTEGLAFRKAFADAGFKLSGVLVWQKDSLVLGRSDYQWIHEPILYGWKPGASHRWYGGRKKTTVAEHGDSGPIRRMADGRWCITVGETVLVVDGSAELFEAPSSIVRCQRPKRSDEHPTMKPTLLIERQLGASARAGDVVIDCCAGSGSTLIAAERLGMKARVTELEPKFCDVIVRRWQQYSGQAAVRAADGVAMPALEGG